MNFTGGLSDLYRDHWYRNELIRALRRGAGAASLYFSTFSGLLGLILAFTVVKEMEIASTIVFLLMLTLSGIFLIFDLWFYSRNHGLELLRRAGRRCGYQMRRLDVESVLIFNFLNYLDSGPELERIFRVRASESIQALIKALDRLSGTAIRYGPRGKHVFLQNLRSCGVVNLLFQSGEIKLISEPLGPKLKQRLEKVPCYDPEGWSVIFGTPSLETRDAA